jgi:hypothetical protein
MSPRYAVIAQGRAFHVRLGAECVAVCDRRGDAELIAFLLNRQWEQVQAGAA